MAAPQHPLAGHTVALEELAAQPLLLTEKGMSYRRIMDEKMARNSLEIQPVLETGRADQICALAEEQAGVGFLPDYVTEDSVRAGRTLWRRPSIPWRGTPWPWRSWRPSRCC